MKTFDDYEREAEEARNRVQKWGDDPEVEAKLLEISISKQVAEKAKEESALALAYLTIKATKVVAELLEDEDPQVRARAVDLVYSRTIAKVAAKHLEETGETIDSADVASLRESIIAKIKGNQDGS